MSTPKPTSEPEKNIVETTSPEEMMTSLLEFESQDLPVISLYLDARVDAQGRQNFSTFVRKRLTERARTYAQQTPERESIDADLDRIAGYLGDVRPSAQGVAIFACSGADNFFKVGQFAAPFERHQLFAYKRPHVYPLARLIDRYRPYAVVLADTNRAQIFVFASGSTLSRKELQNVKTKQAQIGGWTQSRYERHLENYHIQHAKEIVSVLEDVVRREGIEDVILAGDEATIIPLLREQMPKELSSKIIDVMSLAIDTPEHALLEESLAVYRQHDSFSDREKVEQLMNEYGADGRAVVGVPQTFAALSNGQVEELLIAASSASLQYDEAEVKKVWDAYQTNEGPPAMPDARNIADELVRRANQMSSARITFIENPQLLEHVGGVGALLRYRISAESAAPYEQAGVVPKSQALVEQ
jgi:peptide chain release factor subunit 1